MQLNENIKAEAEAEARAEIEQMAQESAVQKWAMLKIKFDKEFPKQPGRKTLKHNGTTYERTFRKQYSNSRKTFRWLMDFRITRADGTVETVEDPIGPNRSNDPDRNWGLGRE